MALPGCLLMSIGYFFLLCSLYLKAGKPLHHQKVGLGVVYCGVFRKILYKIKRIKYYSQRKIDSHYVLLAGR